MKYYKELIKFLNSKKKICVYYKGVDTKIVPKGYDCYIGVKQAITLLKQKDILVMNDFEGLFGLEKDIKDIKFILLPSRPHEKLKPSETGKEKVLDYLKIHNFKGKLFYYDIQKPTDPKYYQLERILNSGEVIYQFLNFCKNKEKKKIDIYGWYSKEEDYPLISQKIINAKVPQKYENEHKSYLERIYKDKSQINKNQWNIYNSRYNLKQTTEKKEILKNLRNQVIKRNQTLKLKFKTPIF